MEDVSYDVFNEPSIVAPSTQHIDDDDLHTGTQASKLYGCFDPGPSVNFKYDVLNDTGHYPRTHCANTVENVAINDLQFRQKVQLLNLEQMQFFYHVLHEVKMQIQPLRIFLSGGAGVGKSFVLNTLYQAVTKYFNQLSGKNPDDIRAMKVAPTGKAAFNINGNTIHSAFNIPVSQGFNYLPLDNDRLNTIRKQYKTLKIIFIDEISMVGAGLFNFLNQRLQQIMGTQSPFGGLSIIAVGDLFQLQPVFDKWIFEGSSSEYSTFATNIWQEHFQFCELLTIMRQKDDKSLHSF